MRTPTPSNSKLMKLINYLWFIAEDIGKKELSKFDGTGFLQICTAIITLPILLGIGALSNWLVALLIGLALNLGLLYWCSSYYNEQKYQELKAMYPNALSCMGVAKILSIVLVLCIISSAVLFALVYYFFAQ